MRTRTLSVNMLVCVGVFIGACGGDDAAKQEPRDVNPVLQAGASAAANGGSGVSTPSTPSGAVNTVGGSAGRVAPGGVAMPGAAGNAAMTPPIAPVQPAVTPTAPAAPPPTAAPAPVPPAGPPGTWPAADPGKAGPFKTVTENPVGPGVGYTLFRPMMLTQRTPVITWGNGTGGVPSSYGQLLNLLATHGFIVIASNSGQVAMEQPPPMLEAVKWVIEQDAKPDSPLFGKVDHDRIGATGHSQGAFGASSAGTDPMIKTTAPIEALAGGRGFHGPVLGICGTNDTAVGCTTNLSAFNAINDQPVMYAECKTVDHSNWIFSTQGLMNPIYVITTAWFRVQFMNDMALRPMFYGECSLCKDTATWNIMRKKMDN
jgi:hypothetical protein